MSHFAYQVLGFGSGPPAEAAFLVEILALEAAILLRDSDEAGTIAYGTDTENFYIFDGAAWFSYPEQQ